MANPKYYSAGNIPSAWVIVFVAALLILLPSLFCGGILLMSGSKTSPTQGAQKQQEGPKRPELPP